MKRAMRQLVVVIAVFLGWTVATPPSSFATDFPRQRPEQKVLSLRGAQRSAGSAVDCAPSAQNFRMSRRWCGLPDTNDGGFRQISCAENTVVALRPVYPHSPVPKPRQLRVTLHYDALALRFVLASHHADSLCTLMSQRGALPVISDVSADPGTSPVTASQQVAASVTTATLDIIPTRTDIPRCDFFLMRLLGRPTLDDSTKPLPDDTNECYLNEPSDNPTSGLTARWSIPGFEEYAPNEHGGQVYQTRALT